MRLLTAILLLITLPTYGQLWFPIRLGTGSTGSTTFDPSRKGNQAVLSGGNKVLTANTGNSGAALTPAITSGKVYAEFTVNTFVTAVSFGIINSSGTADLNSGSFIGASVNGWGHLTLGTSPTKRHSGGSGNGTAYGVAIGTGGIVSIAFDYTNGNLYIGLNGTWMASSDPVAGTGAIWTGIPAGTYYVCADVWAGGTITFNSTNTYTPPTGYTAL